MLEGLNAALGGPGEGELRGAAALRVRTRMQSAGGPGTRLMPPTYSPRPDAPRDAQKQPVYLTEQRRVEDGDQPVECVLLDSLASQSNRFEEALLAGVADGHLSIPDITVDQAEFGIHSALEASHRVFDATIEDALDSNGVRFGETQAFQRLSSVINRGLARPLVELFPVGLVLGCWASRKHNPQGATRIARAVTSEIVGFDMLPGKRAKSRIDINSISNAVPLVPTESDEHARFEVADNPKAKGAKRPSEFGYGNVVPTEADHGGVTVRFAEQTTVVSLAAMRAVRMAERGDSSPPDAEANLAARRLLTLLALSMLELQAELGWDLRSGCQLVPESEPTVEVVGRLGDTVASAPLFGLGAVDALRHAVNEAKAHGIDWEVPPIALTASPEQLELLRRSLGVEADGESAE